jgi:hypothetical protein
MTLRTSGKGDQYRYLHLLHGCPTGEEWLPRTHHPDE